MLSRQLPGREALISFPRGFRGGRRGAEGGGLAGRGGGGGREAAAETPGV